MAKTPEPKLINTLADLLADLAEFKGDPKTTPVRFYDGAEPQPLSVVVYSHHSAPNKQDIRFERRLDRDLLRAEMRRRLAESEEELGKTVEKLDKLRKRLTWQIQARDQNKAIVEGTFFK